jgi:NAD(P)-dependent dehydrogenase (short-subunit alcohol dehydrogenase family)
MSASVSKRIVLTGVSRGLGLAMAEGFIAAGHTVWGCARNESTVAKLAKRWPNPHQFTALDVADDAQVARWATAAEAALESIDLLINNAALMNRPAPLWEISAREFSDLIDVNIKGVAHCIRHFVPTMVARGSGVIVNFSSGWGRSTSAQVAPYCASKWAIEGLSQALAQELPEGMAAVALNPGVIDTDMLRTCWGDSVGSYPDAESWARRAVPFIMQIGPKDNGRPLAVRST